MPAPGTPTTPASWKRNSMVGSRQLLSSSHLMLGRDCTPCWLFVLRRCAAYALAALIQLTFLVCFCSAHLITTILQMCPVKSYCYSTPIGDLPVDLEVIEELKATGKFEFMDLNVDEAEHSMEMHLPYLSKVFQGHDVKVVPILVGAVNSQSEAMYGQLLAKYVDDPKNFFLSPQTFATGDLGKYFNV
ncbi:hypothetical protein D1007_53670 [Hordeum vulgare]|nr:hypothetical protein D1007_53670 [Hordeum vulgare]